MTCLWVPFGSIAENYRSGLSLDVSPPDLQREYLTVPVISRRENLQVLIVCRDIRRFRRSHLHRLRSVHLQLDTELVATVCHSIDIVGASVVDRPGQKL